MAASCLGSIWPAVSPPKIRSATSPGMTRMITKTSAAAPSSVGTISRSRFATYVPIASPPGSGSVFRQPDVLELLVRVVIGRRYVILHLGPVDDVARPPEPGHVVRVFEHGLLELEDRLLPLGGVERARLPREQVVDARIGEPAPVLRIAGRVPSEEEVGVVAGLDRRADDQFEVAAVPPIREPGSGLERPMLGLDADLPPLLDREHRDVLIRELHVAVLEYDLEAIRVAGLGQEFLGLRSVLLHVLPEPRQFLQLGLRHRELGAGTQETAHVLQARQAEQHSASGVAVEPERERLADADVGERLHRVVDDDPELARHRRLLDDDLVTELLLDRFDLGRRQIAELDVGAAGPDGGRPHRGLRADEELVAVEVGPVLL